MAKSIMEVIQEHVNPTSVSNAIYEVMVDWRNHVLMAEQAATASQEKRHTKKRGWTEQVLSRFLGVDQIQTRNLLNQHFFNGDKRFRDR